MLAQLKHRLRPRRTQLATTCALLALTSGNLSAQGTDLGFSKGDSVVLAVPAAFVNIQRTGWAAQNTKFDIDARFGESGAEVMDPTTRVWRRDWRFRGLPSRGRYLVNNIKTVSRTGETGRFIEVTLRVTIGLDYRLFAPADQPQALRELIAPVSAADSMFQVAYTALGPQLFTGVLSSFTPDERTTLLKWAHLTANSSAIGAEAYKGLTYLTIALPGDGDTWNDLRVTRSQRLGRLIGEQLALLKVFARTAIRHDSLGGVRMAQPSRHGTAPYYTDVANDEVVAYFPLDALLQFADADITSQALVNRSVILLNGDRIEIDLSTQ